MKTVAPVEAFDHVFREEQARTYPRIDAFEEQLGYAIDRTRLETAARVLACPVKAHQPCWQHGRVVYAAARLYLATDERNGVVLLDIGTAKGFSALCLLWAAQDAGVPASVWSCDVIDPASRVPRNTVAECDGMKTLVETLAPWPEAEHIRFVRSSGIETLEHFSQLGLHVGVAFIDGKHQQDVVTREGELLAAIQQPGDVAIFDDCQIPGVQQAINSLGDVYRFKAIEAKPERAYVIGVRR
jgi:predicted O-methyltransferase YrrM